MYYYKHTNGAVIAKPDWVVDSTGPGEYFDSPFCVKWWYVPIEPPSDEKEYFKLQNENGRFDG